MLADWERAPLPDRLRSTLRFLEKLTHAPESVDARDLRAMREAGLNDAAIRDAIYVCSMFNVMDRLEHAFGFSTAGSRLSARSLRWIGYRMF